MDITRDPALTEEPRPLGDDALARPTLGSRIARSRWARAAIGAGAGATLGLGYYALVGCSTGACPITSSPLVSAIYGALVGLIAASR